MIAFLLRVLAFVMFMAAGFDSTALGQSSFDWVAFGLAAWILAVLLSGWGPEAPPQTKQKV